MGPVDAVVGLVAVCMVTGGGCSLVSRGQQLLARLLHKAWLLTDAVAVVRAKVSGWQEYTPELIGVLSLGGWSLGVFGSAAKATGLCLEWL